MDLVDDDRSHGAKHQAAALGGQKKVERLRRRHQNVRRDLQHRRPIRGRRVAGPDRRRDPRRIEAGALRDVADPLPWFREILVDVRAQRLQRGNVEDPDFVWKRSAQAFCEEIIDRRQKGRERLAGSRRRGDERVTPFAYGRPAATLRSRRLAQRLRKPLLDNGVEGRSTHGNRLGRTSPLILAQGQEGIAGSAIRYCSGERRNCDPSRPFPEIPLQSGLAYGSHPGRPWTITSGCLRARPPQSPTIRRSRWDSSPGPFTSIRIRSRTSSVSTPEAASPPGAGGIGWRRPVSSSRAAPISPSRRSPLRAASTRRAFSIASSGDRVVALHLNVDLEHRHTTPPSAFDCSACRRVLRTFKVGLRQSSWLRRQSFGLFVNRQRGTPRGREWQTRIMHCVFVTPRFGSPAQRQRTVPTTRRKRCRMRRGGPWRLRGQLRWRSPCQCRRRTSAPSAGLVPGTPGRPSAPKSRSVAVYATRLIRPPRTMAPR